MTSISGMNPVTMDNVNYARYTRLANGLMQNASVDDVDEVEKNVKEFVAGTFFSIMLKEMQKTVPENSYFSSKGEEVFRSLLCEEYKKVLSVNADYDFVQAAYKQVMGDVQ